MNDDSVLTNSMCYLLLYYAFHIHPHLNDLVALVQFKCASVLAALYQIWILQMLSVSTWHYQQDHAKLTCFHNIMLCT